MKVPERLALLKKIYEIHDLFALDAQWACHSGCVTCCTCNVTATTMEGLLVYDHLISTGQRNRLENIMVSWPCARFQPKITLNHMVALCARGEETPDETHDPSAGVCPLLKEDVCSIYPVRPLGCRAMLSVSDCSLSGEAQISPFMLSVNNVVMQYLEAVDQPGGTGNLIDVLRYLSVDAHYEAYLQGQSIVGSKALLANRPFPVLMVPPEHRQSIQPLIQSLNTAIHLQLEGC
jgi:Fe-S-cluster containining protein